MKSIAGSIVVLSGALILGLAKDDIPREILPTLLSVGLIITGLLVVFLSDRNAPNNKS